MGQRISRAKRLLAQSGASLEMPTGAERELRLGDVMAVVYLVFNEGYAATTGEHWTRPELCLEAMRLARILAALVPDDPEAQGLQALLELQGSRLAARRDAAGRPVLLEAQDRSRWDQLLIRRGLAALDRAEALGIAGRPVGTYVLQAAIAACHARARRSAGHGLGRDRPPVRRPRRLRPRAGGRGQPRRGARPRLRAGRRAHDPGRDR